MAVVNAAGATRPIRMLTALRRRWYIVVLAGIAGAVAAFGLSTTVTPVYSSHASLYFSLRAGDSATDINQGLTYTQNQMLSFAQLATSSAVLDRVVDNLGDDVTLTSLRRQVSVSTPQQTVILDVAATTPDRALSSRIANSVANNLEAVVAKLAPADSTGKSTVAAHVIEPAVPARFQASPDKQKNAMLGGLGGIALAIAALFAATVLDTRVRSVSALRSITDRPLLGIAERTRGGADTRPAALRQPNGSAAERYRQIRAGLRFAAAGHRTTVIAVTSSVPGEGKTMAALNLAVIMAESKERVLLVDADLRRPRVADYLGLEPTIGLTTVLVGGVTAELAIQRFGRTSLQVLPAGEVPPNPAELLASAPMRELLEQVKREYDTVIVDTAPLLSVADAAVIAQQSDSVVLVADSSKLRRAQLEQALDALDTAGAYVAGIILNRVRPSRRRDSYYREYRDDAPAARRWFRRRVVPVVAVEGPGDPE